MRVATYNLYLGADLSLLFGTEPAELPGVVDELMRQLTVTDFPSRARAVARLLVANEVDLVGLQEVTLWSRGDEVVFDFLAELTAALTEQGAGYDVHAVNDNFSGSGAQLTVEGSNVTLVRRGIEVESEKVGELEHALTVPTPMGDVRIARSWGWVDAVVGERPVRFVNTHTEAYDEQVRNAQRDELLGRIGDPGRPVVLVGDFNSSPDRVGVPAPYVDAWVAAGGDPDAGFTCCQAADLSNEMSTLHERIDYVWVRDATVLACRLVGAELDDRTASGLWPSDHAAVVAELEM